MNPKQGYFRRRGWKDLTFLAVVLALALWVRRLPQSRTDLEKWKARPQLNRRSGSFSQQIVGTSGPIPCFFAIPKAADDQPGALGTVGDCLELAPDGRKLDLFEVNLWTGDLVPIATDDYVPGTISLAFTRVVSPVDDWARRYQVFLRHVYDPYLTGDRFPYTYLDWTLPDNMHIHYWRVSPGTGYADAVYESGFYFSIFGWSRIKWNGFGWDLALQGGTTYLSPEAYNATRPQQGSLVGIFDDKGNEIRLSRKSNGDLSEIKSPSGQWIKLIYDDRGRIIQIKDSAESWAKYEYDSENRLASVSYRSGRRVIYEYNSTNRVTETQDTAGVSVLRVDYDSNSRVSHLTLADGSAYSFRYGPVQDGMNAWAEILSPQSKVTKIALHRNSYTIEKMKVE